MIGKLKIGDQIRQIHVRFTNVTDYEADIGPFDQDYESDDTIFNGYIYKIVFPQFNLVNRSQYVSGCNFKHEITEHQGRNCFTPTKRYCLVKCINFLTGGDYKQQNLDFIRNKKNDQILWLKLDFNHFVEPIIVI